MLFRILNVTLFLLLLSSNLTNLFAQADSILIEDSFPGYKYFYQGEKISGNEVLDLLIDHPIVYDKFKSASEAYIFANIFSVFGIVLIATPAGMKMAGYESNWSMAWAGAGFMVVSIPLIYKYNKNIPIALDLYNKNPVPELEPTAVLKVGVTNNGFGLSYHF